MKKSKHHKKILKTEPTLLQRHYLQSVFNENQKIPLNQKSYKKQQIPKLKLKQLKKKQICDQFLSCYQKNSKFKIKQSVPYFQVGRQQLRIRTAPDQPRLKNKRKQIFNSYQQKESAYVKRYQVPKTSSTTKQSKKKHSHTRHRSQLTKIFNNKKIDNKNRKQQCQILFKKKKSLNQVVKGIGYKRNKSVNYTAPIQYYQQNKKTPNRCANTFFLETKLLRSFLDQRQQPSNSCRFYEEKQKKMKESVKFYNIKNYLNSIDMRLMTKIRQDISMSQTKILKNYQQSNNKNKINVQQHEPYNFSQQKLQASAIVIQRFWRRFLNKKILQKYRKIFTNVLNIVDKSRTPQETSQININIQQDKQNSQNQESDNKKIIQQRVVQAGQDIDRQFESIKLIKVPIQSEIQEKSHQLKQSSYESSISGSQLQYYNQYIDFSCLIQTKTKPFPQFIPPTLPVVSKQRFLKRQLFNSNQNSPIMAHYIQKLKQENEFLDCEQSTPCNSLDKIPIVNKHAIENQIEIFQQNVDEQIFQKVRKNYNTDQPAQLATLKRQFLNIVRNTPNKRIELKARPFQQQEIGLQSSSQVLQESQKQIKVGIQWINQIQRKQNQQIQDIVSMIIYEYVMQFVQQMKIMVLSIENNANNNKNIHNNHNQNGFANIWDSKVESFSNNQEQNINQSTQKGQSQNKKCPNLRINMKTIRIYLQLIKDIILSSQQLTNKVTQNLQHGIGLSSREVLQTIRNSGLNSDNSQWKNISYYADWVISVPPEVYLEASSHIKSVQAQMGRTSQEMFQFYQYWYCSLFECFNECLDQWRPFGQKSQNYPWKRHISIPHFITRTDLPYVLNSAQQRLLTCASYQLATIYDKQTASKQYINLSACQKIENNECRMRQYLYEYVMQDNQNWDISEIQVIQVVCQLANTIQEYLIQQIVNDIRLQFLVQKQ